MSEEKNINELIQLKKKQGILETNNISDGFHTFGELYDHRINLFIALCKEIAMSEDKVWKSKLHDDGSEFEGWFIMGIGKQPGKMITYHLPMDRWAYCEAIPTIEKGLPWDGHTSDDVLKRLLEL